MAVKVISTYDQQEGFDGNIIGNGQDVLFGFDHITAEHRIEILTTSSQNHFVRVDLLAVDFKNNVVELRVIHVRQKS
jgi:hypothetical protein